MTQQSDLVRSGPNRILASPDLLSHAHPCECGQTSESTTADRPSWALPGIVGNWSNKLETTLLYALNMADLQYKEIRRPQPSSSSLICSDVLFLTSAILSERTSGAFQFNQNATSWHLRREAWGSKPPRQLARDPGWHSETKPIRNLNHRNKCWN
ncbi:hypothetical protein BDW67DRAFT_3561 [Aspergillus spinulosporus]